MTHPITKDGLDWLIAAADPFHDLVRPIEGCPDHCVTKSFVRQHTKTITVAAANDDDKIGIVSSGFFGPARTFKTRGTSGSAPSTMLSAGYTIHPISILSSAAAYDPNFPDYMSSSATLEGGFNPVYESEIPARVIALGVEVKDVSNALYKRGSIVAVHSNGENINGVANFYDGTTYYPGISVSATPTLVGSFASATSLKGCYVGKAEDGIYLVSRFNEPQKPRASSEYTQDGSLIASQCGGIPLITQEYEDSKDYVCQPCNADSMLTMTSNTAAWYPTGFAPFAIYINGLSESSVLSVTFRSVVEYFPRVDDPTRFGITTISPTFDPNAFIMYHEAMKYMPTAVPVSMNPAGEYFSMVLKVLKRIGLTILKNSPAILDAVGQPELATIAAATKALVIRRNNKKKKPTRKAK